MTVSAETTYQTADGARQIVISFSERDKYVDITQTLLTTRRVNRGISIKPGEYSRLEVLSMIASLEEAVSFFWPDEGVKNDEEED